MARRNSFSAFAQSQARIAVICSTDENYPSLVPALTAAIQARRPDALIVLAGYPQDHVEQFKAAGVDEFIHLRADAGDVLKSFLTRLGIDQ